MQSFDAAEIQARHQRLQELMKASGSNLDAIIVLNTADLYYLSGTVQTAPPPPPPPPPFFFFFAKFPRPVP